MRHRVAPGVPHVWVIQSQRLSMSGRGLGFKGNFFVTAVFSNYNNIVATYPAPPAPKAAAPAGQPETIAPVTTRELSRQIKREKPDLAGLSRQVRRQV
ncbi:MAG: hypothetical protein EOO59_04395, partial [Hymenobacter sp.]